MENLKTEDLYFCYDRKLSDIFSENGIKYLVKAKSIKTNAVFTLYTKTEKVNKIMREFYDNK